MAARSAVIVGAGPTGLTLALLLHKAGLDVTVFEQGPREVPVSWKGSTIHPPTLELFDQLGIAGTIVSGGVRVDRLQYRDAEFGEYAEFDYSLLAGRTPYPFRLQFEQYKLLELLRASCDASPGLDVRYETAVTGVTGAASSAPSVTARRSRDDQPGTAETVRADFVVGADGARSSTRKVLGAEFDGTTYAEPNAVLATDYDLRTIASDLGPVSYWTSPHGKVSFIRTPDHWRIGLTARGRLAEADPSGWGRELLTQVFGLPPTMPLNQASTFRIHQRLASGFAAGRVCLIGDAAHVNSPTGGLGLNSGIADAFDLATRIAEAGDPGQALAAYAVTRSAVARHVVQKVSARNTAMSSGKDRASREDVMSRLRALSADKDAATEYLLEVCMITASRAYPPGTRSVPA